MAAYEAVEESAEQEELRLNWRRQSWLFLTKTAVAEVMAHPAIELCICRWQIAVMMAVAMAMAMAIAMTAEMDMMTLAVKGE